MDAFVIFSADCPKNPDSHLPVGKKQKKKMRCGSFYKKFKMSF
jgi:hypothetical protein